MRWFLCDGFSYELLVCYGFFMQIVSMRLLFMHIVSLRIIFSMKRGYVYVWETCKNVWVLQVCFLKSKSIQAKKYLRLLVCDGFLGILLVCGGFSYGLLVCGGFSYELLVCNGFFMHIVSFRIIFSMKRLCVCLGDV